MSTAGEHKSTAVAVIRTSEPLRKRRHWPHTLEARMDLGVPELRVPATFEEYLAFSQDCDYRVHYRDGHIISFVEIDEQTNAVMGEASLVHELLVARIIQLLATLLESPGSDFQILGSKARIFIAEDRKGVNADVTVVRGDLEEKTYKFNRRKVTGLTNPWLIVEILSNSARDFDLSEKLNDYKQIPSLQQVIFIEQDFVGASTYIQVSPKEWRNLDLSTLDNSIPVINHSISLEQIYRKIL